MDKIQLFKDVILVTKMQENLLKNPTESKFILPESIQNKQYAFGRVDAIGDKVTLGVKIGDIVFFSIYAGVNVQFDDALYIILREDDVYGKKLL